MAERSISYAVAGGKINVYLGSNLVATWPVAQMLLAIGKDAAENAEHWPMTNRAQSVSVGSAP